MLDLLDEHLSKSIVPLWLPIQGSTVSPTLFEKCNESSIKEPSLSDGIDLVEMKFISLLKSTNDIGIYY